MAYSSYHYSYWCRTWQTTTSFTCLAFIFFNTATVENLLVLLGHCYRYFYSKFFFYTLCRHYDCWEYVIYHNVLEEPRFIYCHYSCCGCTAGNTHACFEVLFLRRKFAKEALKSMYVKTKKQSLKKGADVANVKLNRSTENVDFGRQELTVGGKKTHAKNMREAIKTIWGVEHCCRSGGRKWGWGWRRLWGSPRFVERCRTLLRRVSRN